MFCKNCGKEMLDEAVICPFCGVATENFQSKEHKKETNGMAIAGFVCSFFVPILGWVFGGIGLSRANRRGGKGKGLSIAAITIASASAFLYFVSML